MGNGRLQTAIKPLSGWYHGLGHRDQVALRVLALVVGLFLLYSLIWAPAREYRNEAAAARLSALDDLQWMRSNAAQARIISGRGQNASAGLQPGQSLLSVINSTAASENLQLQRFEPRGDDRINLWLEDVDFNRLMLWLEMLKSQFGIQVEQISIDRARSPGLVSANLALSL